VINPNIKGIVSSVITCWVFHC